MRSTNFRALLPLLIVMVLVTSALGTDKPKDNVLTLHGEIMDSQCGFNVHSEGHSHDLMTKSKLNGTRNGAACTQHCVKEMGGSYVLVAQKDVYKLEDQEKPELFAGKKVKITGRVDTNTHLLHIVTIDEEK
ncbi:MAG TPA: hypothetical protein VIB39_05605 [Candidatus Angelobacter sp.]|jgi:hypothetical protein